MTIKSLYSIVLIVVRKYNDFLTARVKIVMKNPYKISWNVKRV